MLSLEAPLVAVLWQHALAHAHGVHLPPMLDAGLALACWLIYVIDRTLDTLAHPAHALDARHAFYLCHRRVLLAGVLPPALLLLAWMAFFVIPEGVLWQALGLSLLVALYLASWPAQGAGRWRDLLFSCAGLGAILLISHMPLEAGQRLVLSVLVLVVMVLAFLRQLEIRFHMMPKATAAALLFAMGCTTSTRFLAMPERWLEPVVECVLLALLFACNLHGISNREQNTTLASWRHALRVLGTLVFALGVLWLVEFGLLESSLHATARVVTAATVLYALVFRFRERLSPDTHRVLADLALIAPLPLVWW